MDAHAAPTSRARGIAAGAALVGIGLACAQALGYLLNVLVARSLGPDAFGAFASLLSILVIGSVLGGALQAVGARRLARATAADQAGASSTILRVSVFAGLLLMAFVAALSPVLRMLLHLEGWLPLLLTAVAFLPITVAGAQYAIAQGRDDHIRLGATYAIVGAGKAIGGILGALLLESLMGALLGVAVGSLAAMCVGIALLRGGLGRPRQVLPGFVRESLHATHALGALFVLTNIDVILARFLLSADAAGLYAVGSIVTKIAFWLPQFVSVVAFTRMAGSMGARATRLAVLAVAAIGLAVVMGAAIAGGTIVQIIGGPDYSTLSSSLWLFALTGSLFALGQTLLLSRIAQDDRGAVLSVWAAVLVVAVLAVTLAHSTTSLVLCAAAGGVLLCGLGLIIARRAGRTRSGQ